MSKITNLDANFIRQIARANGLEVSLERAEALLPALRDLLAVDAKIAKLSLHTLSAVGQPWAPGELPDDD